MQRFLADPLTQRSESTLAHLAHAFVASSKRHAFEVCVSAYVASGIFLFHIIHWVAGIYLAELGRTSYAFTFEQALFGGTYSSTIIFIGELMLLLETRKAAGSGRFLSYAMASFVFLFASTLLWFAFADSGLLNAFNLSYVLALGVLLLTILGLRYSHKSPNQTYTSLPRKIRIDLLKMEHRELLQHLNLMVWALFVLLTGGLIAALAPSINPLQGDPRYARGIYLELLNHAILIVYYLFGVGFGVILQFLKALGTIRENIAFVASARDSTE